MARNQAIVARKEIMMDIGDQWREILKECRKDAIKPGEVGSDAELPGDGIIIEGVPIAWFYEQRGSSERETDSR